MFQVLFITLRCIAGCGEVRRIVLGCDPARDCKDRLRPHREFCCDDSQRVGLAFDNLRGATLSLELIIECSLEGCWIDEGRGQPYPCHSGWLQNLDACRHFERAPRVRHCPREQASWLGKRYSC